MVYVVEIPGAQTFGEGQVTSARVKEELAFVCAFAHTPRFGRLRLEAEVQPTWKVTDSMIQTVPVFRGAQ
jgi:hypothetical protein